jgi:hypothetical protein
MTDAAVGLKAWEDEAAADAVAEPPTVMEPPATFAVGVSVIE